jgi:hypothetical protein
MIDENIVRNEPQTAQLNPVNDNPEHAPVGKIARFPKEIRDQLNRRLENGDLASEILPWLNELSPVKTVLARHFAGASVTEQNLTNWRQGGFQRWLKKQEPLAAIQELSEDAADISRAGRGRIATGAATVASSQILEFLRSIPPDKRSTADLAKFVSSTATLIKAEQANARLQLAQKRVQQKDEQLLLTRDRDQRNVVATGLRLLGDARAKQIEASPRNHNQKIELLGRHMFGKLWQLRPIQSNPA